MAVPIMSIAAPTPLTVNLGNASSFAVLAGSGISNTGSTTINGDVITNTGGNIGLSPGSAVTGFPPGIVSNGAIHAADALASGAQDALTTAYNDAFGRPVDVDLTGQDLGGLTLTPGVYSFSTSAQLTGTLTLDGLGETDPVFIFKVGATLITASGSDINLINGARYCRTFWQIGSSATLGTTSHFVGHIFALTSITANTGATVQGQLLARNGAVTLDSNTITNGFCGALRVTKVFSASTTPSPVVIRINGQSPKTFNAVNGWTQTWENLPTGNYTITEDNLGLGWTNQILPTTTIPVLDGATATAAITNTYTPSSNGGGSGGDESVQVYPPLINVVKTPEPLALTSGQGSVTYTYKVTNPGTVALSAVSVADDKVSPVNYVSGDVNNDNLLQANETWIYTSKTNLGATTTNTATAIGNANGMSATDIAIVTVVVSGTPTVPPLINVVKTPEPLALTSGQGSVTYTYKVTNPGTAALSEVSVSDDMVSPVNYVSGDVNNDNLLQANETWIYTSKMNLSATTMNTATVKGSANGMTATDVAFATVIVTVTNTVTGGQLPKTSTPLYEVLIIGAVLTLVGDICWRNRKRYE
ncbi:ice-binding family protein [Dehalobacter sp. 4CP]|uniref:ice-binding family protein n=1 Tax=Dehalobacter sp. CP TaxID=2594474 RepID=UPI0039E9510D